MSWLAAEVASWGGSANASCPRRDIRAACERDRWGQPRLRAIPQTSQTLANAPRGAGHPAAAPPDVQTRPAARVCAPVRSVGARSSGRSRDKRAPTVSPARDILHPGGRHARNRSKAERQSCLTQRGLFLARRRPREVCAPVCRVGARSSGRARYKRAPTLEKSGPPGAQTTRTHLPGRREGAFLSFERVTGAGRRPPLCKSGARSHTTQMTLTARSTQPTDPSRPYQYGLVMNSM